MLFWTACVDLAGDEMAQLANQGGYALHDKLIGRKKRKMNDDSIVAQPEFESEQSVMGMRVRTLRAHVVPFSEPR